MADVAEICSKLIKMKHFVELVELVKLVVVFKKEYMRANNLFY